MPDVTQQYIAEAVAASLAEHDRQFGELGMELVSITPTEAVLEMTVTETMLNGFRMCHGAITFALADVAFAIACNATNQRMVAMSSTINYLNAAHPGDRLSAVARQTFLEGRNGICDVTVANQDGQPIVVFRGQCRSVPGLVVPELGNG